MGNCQNCQQPILKNSCNNLGDTYLLEGFCTIGGVGGDGIRDTWCGKLGSEGEWTRDKGSIRYNPCFFNSCKPYQNCGTECIEDGCPTIYGNGAVCQRIGFNGDPGICCLNDNVCSGDSATCFSDPGQRNTCSPLYRDCTSPDCKTSIQAYCSGANDPTTNWIKGWTEGNCYKGLIRNLYNTYDPDNATCIFPGPRVPGTPCNLAPGGFTADGFYWAQGMMQDVFAKYASQGFVLGAAPNEPGYNQFQEYLYDNICCQFPSLCSDGLRAACRNKTVDGIIKNPNSTNWCGCYLPPSAYEDTVTKYGIEIACSPTCNRSSSIPLTGAGGKPLTCDQNVCLLDNVAINLISNTGTANINFTQVCGGCKPGECSCTIGDSSATLVNDTLQNANIDYRNICASINCTQANPNPYGPKTISVPCTDTNSQAFDTIDAQIQQRTQKANTRRSWLIALTVLFLLVVFFVIIYLFY